MKISGIKETCIYVKDLEKTRDFYMKMLGLELITYSEGRHVFFRAGNDVLLCFDPEATRKEEHLPPHFAEGKIHLAFEVPGPEYEQWKEKIEEHGIKILHEQRWKEDKKSFYFSDPEGHLLEILEPGIWE